MFGGLRTAQSLCPLEAQTQLYLYGKERLWEAQEKYREKVMTQTQMMRRRVNTLTLFAVFAYLEGFLNKTKMSTGVILYCIISFKKILYADKIGL